MSADHDDDAPLPGGGDDGIDDGEEIARDEDVGQRAQEGVEGEIRAQRRRGERAGANLVRTSADGNRADGREIRLVDQSGVGLVVTFVDDVYDRR